MLAWITRDNCYDKELVNVCKVEIVTIRHRYMAFTRIYLTTGEVIKPQTLKWVNGHPKIKNVVESLK